MTEEERPGGFLPPKPAGPEPELGPGRGLPPAPRQAQPPPGWQPPPWTPPSGHAWGWAPRPAEPDNGAATAGFVLSLVAGGLLLVSFGTSSIVSVGCAIFGIVQSRRGKQRVADGVTTRNAGLAQAGYIIGIVSLVLSVLATVGWAVVVVLYVTDDQFRDDINNDSGPGSDTITAGFRLAAAAARASAHLLS